MISGGGRKQKPLPEERRFPISHDARIDADGTDDGRNIYRRRTSLRRLFILLHPEMRRRSRSHSDMRSFQLDG